MDKWIEEHRAELVGHCYRMLGSPADADDAVQETMLRAWRNYGKFEGRSSIRTWLYRIATNVCLDTLSSRPQRYRPMELGDVNSVDDPLVEHPRTHWLEPIPDAHVMSPEYGPEQRAIAKQNIRLAFVAALQHLPPKQRAVLILSEVLGWSAVEVADTLETSVASVNSALQRARATLASKNVAEPTSLEEAEAQLLEKYVDAFERYDVDQLTALLRDDATFSMPPYALWLQGPEAVRKWLTGKGAGCRGSRLVRTAACGLPAFGQYRAAPDGGHQPWAIIVLEHRGNRISGWNSFLDTERFFPMFGLPPKLSA